MAMMLSCLLAGFGFACVAEISVSPRTGGGENTAFQEFAAGTK